MTVFVGLDIGSRTCKGVLLDRERVLAKQVIASGSSYTSSAATVRDGLLAASGLDLNEPAYVVVTGRRTTPTFGDEYVTDIQCCARGAHARNPEIRTIIDIEAQTSVVIRVGAAGQVANFLVSEKCAAGSGRFLDILANVLLIGTEDAGTLALKSESPVVFSTGCAVFGESEAISRIAEGISREDILAGAISSIAERLAVIAHRVGLEEPCAIVGGGGLNAGLVKRVAEKLGIQINALPEPQMITALGAAITARERGNGRSLSRG